MNNRPPEPLFITRRFKPLEVFSRFCGATGRTAFNWWRRLNRQIAFLGRLMIVNWQSRNKAPRLILRHTLEQVFHCLLGSLWLLAPLAFFSGYIWGWIWFSKLSNLGGLDSLAILFINGQIGQTVVLGTMIVVVLKYCSILTLETMATKLNGQIQTLRLMGIPPEHFFALPRFLSAFFSFLSLVIFFCLFTTLGAGVTVWQFTMRVPTEFFYELARAAEPEDFIRLAFKSIAVGLLMPTISLYNGWQSKQGMLFDVPPILSRSLLETAAYSIVVNFLLDLAF